MPDAAVPVPAVVAARPRRDPPTTTRRVLAVWRRHVKVYLGVFVWNATPAVFEPLLLLASVGLGVGKHVTAKFNGLEYDAYMAPGILASASMYTSAFEATYGTFVRFRFQGTYDAILATPATVRDLVLGELLWCASKGFFYATLIGGVLAALGFVHGWAALAIPVFGFLNALAIAGLSLLVTSRAKHIDQIQVFFTAVLTPMLFFSGFMFPVDQLPGPLAAAARATPAYHAVETFRMLAAGPEHGSAPWSWACPLILTAYALVLAVLGGAAFHRRILRER
jgi:lipooligosaccharide transport system permease protein